MPSLICYGNAADAEDGQPDAKHQQPRHQQVRRRGFGALAARYRATNDRARIEAASGSAHRYRPQQARRADRDAGIGPRQPVVGRHAERPHRDCRTPVREALQRLAWERLVTIIRRHGIRISDIDPHEQMLVVELRKEFEPLVASRAARRATVDERRYLSKTADSFMEAAATVDVLKFLRVHFESKRFIIACARNPFIADAFAPINALTRRFYFVYQRETRDVAKVRGAARHGAQGDRVGRRGRRRRCRAGHGRPRRILHPLGHCGADDNLIGDASRELPFSRYKQTARSGR